MEVSLQKINKTILGVLIWAVLATTGIGCVSMMGSSRDLTMGSPPKISKSRIPVDAPVLVKKELERLYSQDPVVRGEAAYALGEMHQEATAAIPFLAAMLHDEAQLVWGNTLSGTGGCEGLTSPGKEAATALVKMGKPGIQELITVLNDHRKNQFIRANAAQGLGSAKTSQAVKALIAALKDKSMLVRSYAESALTQIAEEVEEMEKIWSMGNNPTKWQKWWEENKGKFEKANE